MGRRQDRTDRARRRFAALAAFLSVVLVIPLVAEPAASAGPDGPPAVEEQLPGGPAGSAVAPSPSTEPTPAAQSDGADPRVIVPPSAPQALTVTPGGGFVELSWSPPADDGGSPITYYEVENVTTGDVFEGPPDVITGWFLWGLTPGASYTIRVRAHNASGPGPWATHGPVKPTALVNVFTDVKPGHPFYWDIWWGKTWGLTNGYADGSFRSTSGATRQAVMAYFYRAVGSPPGPFPDPGFPDVPKTHPFYTEIAWAKWAGVTNGYGDGTFRPGATVTRQALVAWLYAAAGSPAGPFPNPGFTDVKMNHPFYSAIAWAADVGIAGGYSDGSFRSAVRVSRQATMAFLYRYWFLVP